MHDESVQTDNKLGKKFPPARKALDEFGQNVVGSLSKMGQDVSDYLKKTAEKRYRDIFKDIEIKKREFFLLALIGQSLSAAIILNIVGFVNTFPIGVNQTLGVLGIGLGFIIGLILSYWLLRKLERRYKFLAIALVFSALIHFTYPLLGSIEYLTGIQVGIMGINGFIFGITALLYTTLFIEFTSITERGRVISFNFILIFLSALIFLVFAITGFLSLLVAAIPIVTAIYLLKNQKNEKVEQKRFELSSKGSIRVRIRNNKYLIFYAVIFFAFSVSIGLFFPVGDVGSILLNNIPSDRFFLILLGSLILAAILLFVIGYAYDFVGRRFVIGVAAMILGVLNYGQLFFQALEPIVIPVTFIMVLIMAIPLIVGDFSLTSEIPRGNASFLLITLSGVVFGIFLQSNYLFLSVFTKAGSKEATVMVLAIIILFILMNMKEIISIKEQSWPEMLYHLYVIHESGMLLYEHSFKSSGSTVEADLVSGGIIGLTTMLEEIVHGNQHLRTIDHGDKKLLFRYSADQKIVYVLLIKEDLLVIRNKMRTFAEDFESTFADQIAKFNGVKLDTWKSTKDIVQKNFERKYFLS